MKKLAYLGFCLVLAMGVGCAITNYGLITDNDQVSNGQGSGVVNTNGKAKISSAQVATIWPDGTDELFSMVDQKSNGDRTLTTYNNFSTGDDPTFLDDFYCNPDWQGCAIFTAPDPEVGDADIFDGTLNANCFGARSLSVSVSTGRYYGECGRAKLGVADRVALGNMGDIVSVNGQEGLLYNLNRNNFSITLDNNAGIVSSLPISGDAQMTLFPTGKTGIRLALSNPLNGNTGRAAADFFRTASTDLTTVTVTYNGISMDWNVGGERLTSANVLSFVNNKF